MTSTKQVGAWGEALAAEYLRRKHFKILASGYACRFGEIDLIAQSWRYLIFVEVKLRKSADYGLPREFVNRAKQERLRTTAQLYLSQHPTDRQPRFDVIEIYAPEGMLTAHPKICHLEDAF